jgi:hypothetical protein
MTFADQLATDLAGILGRDFGESITYNGVSINCHFNQGAWPFAKAWNGDAAVIVVAKSDVATPGYRDTIIRSGVTWKVYAEEDRSTITEGDDLSSWLILLYKGEKLVLFE